MVMDEETIERELRRSLPRWKVYLTGRGYYYGTTNGEFGRNVKHYYSDPRVVDQNYRLVAIREGGRDSPALTIVLSAAKYWTEGDAYFTDELGLSIFDLLGLSFALEDAGSEPPTLPGSMLTDPIRSDEIGDMFLYEEGEGGSSPPHPDPGPDEHTYNPPSHIGGPQVGGGWCPGGARAQPRHSPRRLPSARPRQPSTHRSLGTGPARQVPTGVGSNERPVGKYPGWDHPHPGEAWQVFRCNGIVYEGYLSDCPDFQAAAPGDRWMKLLNELIGRALDNMHHNIALLRNDPHCLESCKLAVFLPTVLSVLCVGKWGEASGASIAKRIAQSVAVRVGSAAKIGAASAFVLLCEILAQAPIAAGSAVGTFEGASWCREKFCKPPSGSAQE